MLPNCYKDKFFAPLMMFFEFVEILASCNCQLVASDNVKVSMCYVHSSVSIDSLEVI